MTDSIVPEGMTCKPNISATGRRRRVAVGYVSAGLTVAALGAVIAANVAWPWRLLVALPAIISAFGFLQARRNTCVARASEGVFENSDFSKTKMEDADVAASRKVAATIRRDAFLVGAAVAIISALSALS